LSAGREKLDAGSSAIEAILDWVSLLRNVVRNFFFITED